MMSSTFDVFLTISLSSTACSFFLTRYFIICPLGGTVISFFFFLPGVVFLIFLLPFLVIVFLELCQSSSLTPCSVIQLGRDFCKIIQFHYKTIDFKADLLRTKTNTHSFLRYIHV